MLMTREQKQMMEPKKVLVIDEDRIFADAATADLRTLGYDVQVSYHPQEGIARLVNFDADVVLIDTQIGAHDGIDLIAALRECDPKILCLMVSGQSNTQSAIRALRFGAFDYLEKPVDPARLDAALDRCFDRLNLEREKELAERALAESEARFRAFFENTPVSMSTKDLDGRYQMVNQAFQSWVGCSVEDLVGRKPQEIFQDEAHANALSTLDNFVIETGEPVDGQIKAAGHDGKTKDLTTIKFPIKFDGDKISAIGTVTIDTTARRETERALLQNEELLRSFIDNSDATMTLKGPDGRYLLANKTFKRLHGSEDIVGKTFSEMGGQTDTARMLEIERHIMETGEIVSGNDLVSFANGENWYRRYTKFPVYDGQGDFVGVGAIGNNIMGQMDAEAKLQASEASLRAIINNYPSLISLKDLDGRYILVNEAFAKRFNTTVQNAIGKTVAELSGPTASAVVDAHDEEALRLGSPVTRERSFTNDSGDEIIIAVTKFPAYDGDGELMGVGTISANVSAHRRAEEALRDNETLMRSVIDGIPSPISLKGMDRRFIVVNKAFEELFDLPAQEVIGRTADHLWRETDKAAVNDQEQSVIEAGLPRSDERTDVLASGETVHSIATKFPIFDAKGKVKLIGTMLTDISERKSAEEAVRHSEQQLRSIIDALPISIGYFNKELRYVLANKTNAEWSASDPQSLIGQSLEDIKGSIFPGAKRIFEQTLAGKVKSIETTASYPDGITRDIQVTNVPDFDPEGHVRGFFSMAQDITERKEVERQHIEIEERFRAVLDNFPAAIALKGVDGRYLLVNKTFREWLRIAPGDECIGKTVHDFFPAEAADKIVAHEQAVISEGESLVQERVSPHPDGVTRRTWSHKFPIFGPGGECAALGTVNLDVTEQRNLQAQLSQAQKMEAVGQLTGGVAHDFNNLLGVIVGNLDILAEDVKDSPEIYGMVEPALKAALSGANLTRQLLAFSRKQPLMPQPIELDEHVADMTDMLRRTLGETVDIAIELELGPSTVEVDATQLEAALLNLAVNARDAMPDGGRLTIKTSRAAIDDAYAARHPDVASGAYARLAVSDTGTGMAPEVLRQAFDPFFTTKDVGEGSGLGLSMVFGFTKQSGGHIEINSTVGIGTTIGIYLPIVDETKQTKMEEPEDVDEKPAGNGEKVLVVEDDPEMLVLAVTLLDSLGYQVVQAVDGTSALRILEDTPDFDLLLTDVVMPGGINGIALARKARELYPEMNVLFMSGYAADAIDVEDAEDLEIQLLRKPFRVAEMAEMLRLVLDG